VNDDHCAVPPVEQPHLDVAQSAAQFDQHRIDLIAKVADLLEPPQDLEAGAMRVGYI
jgi:hypothetical protein